MHNNSMVETIIELKMKIAERYKKGIRLFVEMEVIFTFSIASKEDKE